jgi:hypothetical protein
VVSLFERLDKGRPPPVEEVVKQSRKQSRRSADPKILLMDVLVNGPVPATLVEERAAVHGLTKKQLRSAREQMKIVAFKELGKPHGRWFWALSPPVQATGLTSPDSSTG